MSNRIQITIETNSTSNVSYTVRNSSSILALGEVNSIMGATIVLSQSWFIMNSSYTERHKGLYISASAPVCVISSLYSSQNNLVHTHLVLPKHQLRQDVYEYIAVSYQSITRPYNNDLWSFVLLIGNEDNTSVTVTSSVAVDFPLDPQDPRSSMFKFQPGYPHTVTLNRLQTLLFGDNAVKNIANDMTGTNIISSKSLTVISGNDCAAIGERGWFHCGPVAMQIPPVITWGVEFLLPPVAWRATGQYYKVVASHIDTTVNLSCTYTLNKRTKLSDVGSFAELFTISTDHCYLESNQPVLVVQLQLNSDEDDYGASCMIPILSTNQYSNQLLFETPHVHDHVQGFQKYTTHFLSIVVIANDFSPDQIIYDGQPITTNSWSAIRNSNGSVVGYDCILEINKGHHTLHHTDKQKSLLGILSGYAIQSSYGHPIRITHRLSKYLGFYFVLVRNKFDSFMSLFRNPCKVFSV